MAQILKKTSFGLIRTNPRLTTNIKIVADSKNNIFLESIDADPSLTNSIYKGYQIGPYGSYAYDLAAFYNQTGNTPISSSIAFGVYEKDPSLTIKNAYSEQYDFTYGAGAYPKESKLYSEEFAIFAPLWLEADNIPDYFVIFKMDGPVTINPNDSIPGYPQGYTGDFDNAPYLDSLITDPSNFFSNYVQNAKVIKVVDLTMSSSVGMYIRKHVNDSNFPESSLFMSLDSGNYSSWNGISFNKGGFCSISKDIYKEYTLVDKTITELDDFITTGFRDNGVVCANLLNMEFLFDDNDQTKYSFSRYFGMYVSAVQLGQFTIDPNRLFNDRNHEVNQLPVPIFTNIGNPLNPLPQSQTNTLGIKVYPNVSGPSGIYSGRLLTFSELQNPRFGYVQDVKGNFYSVDNVTDWATTSLVSGTGPTGLPYMVTDTNYLRLKNTSIDWSTFGGMQSPFNSISALETDKLGRPGIGFSIISSPQTGDEIRVQFTDWTNPKELSSIDTHTVIGDSSLPAGSANGLLFSVNGAYNQIVNAICSAINNIQFFSNDYQIFSAVPNGTSVIVYCRIQSENWNNKLKISIFSEAAVFPYTLSNQYADSRYINDYLTSPISLGNYAVGNYIESYFYGGNGNPLSRAIIPQSNILEFVDSTDTVYVKTNKGFDSTGGYGLYLDEPVYDDLGNIISFNNVNKYFVVNLEDNTQNIVFSSSGKLLLYKLAKNSCGYFSLFPIKDFDFDFLSTEYNTNGDSTLYSTTSSTNNLLSWYEGNYGPTGTTGQNGYEPIFGWTSIGQTAINDIINIIGPSSSFSLNGGFQTLIGYTDEITDEVDSVTNEYDRLKEVDIAQIALTSRVVPFINKWVYENGGLDVRENGYRLDTNASFGYSNFSPSFDMISRNVKFFTHEWYYLQQYPPYMTFEDKLNSFSYFDEDLYCPPIPDPSFPNATSIYAGLTGATGASANLLSINENYFLEYFTRETISELPIAPDFKYSIFSIGDYNRPSESLFRGAKVQIRDRSENSPINYNKQSLSYVLSEKYNGYAFSAVLTYGNAGTELTFIKNDVFKAVTLVIQANLNDALLSYITPLGATGKFIDRAMLYCLDNQYVLGPSGTLNYSDKPVSGFIGSWTDNGSTFVINGVPDANGNFPKFTENITLNAEGSYNPIIVTDGTYTYTFSGIVNVNGNSFECASISGLPIIGTLYPNGNNTYDWLINQWGGNYLIFSAPFNTNPIYLGGGYGAYLPIMDSISFASIASSINEGDPSVRYINVDTSGNVIFNTYTIDLIAPDYPITSTYLQRQVIAKDSTTLQYNTPIIGYTLSSLPRTIVSPISRYRGNYDPKWIDIVNFVDTDDLKSDGLDYNNIQILTSLYDSYGNNYYSDPEFGKIRNMYFNKVNVKNQNVISNNSTLSNQKTFVYPLIGEIAIDYEDFFIFKSNWDAEYYTSYSINNLKTPIIGTREPDEQKSFFGSKVISIPSSITIDTFPTGIITNTQLKSVGSINNTTANIVETLNYLPGSTSIELDFYITKSLQNWLINDGFGENFSKYINPNYSYGNGISDEINAYIEDNIFARYSIKEIIMWELTWSPVKGTQNPPQVQTTLTDAQKVAAGYVQSKNFKTILSQNGLDFELIYTIPTDRRTSIAVTVVLNKN